MITAEEKTIKPNLQQQKCIETLEGPVMVLAGPGTGKTFTIIERIKYMLLKGISPESILCLTYSEAAANEMKVRLVKECGASAAAVSIHTYHAFCSEVIKQYPFEFELMEGLSVADDITKQTLMTETVKEFKPVYHVTKWGDTDFYVRELLEDVNKIKQSGINKEQYFYNIKNHSLWQKKMDELENELKDRKRDNKPIKTFMSKYERHKKKIGKAIEAWEIYELYDKKLKKNNFIDFNDMINMVLEVFNTDDELLNKVSNRYKYFLVDEYQDTNYAQNNIVFKLAEGAKNNNVFVVGDDDQIIYEFQGAKTDTLEKFLKRYPETKVICLDENNRSTQTILDFSYKVISQDSTRLEYNSDFKSFNIRKALVAKNESVCAKDRKIKLNCFAEKSQELNYIVKEIENLISSRKVSLNNNGDVDLSSIAVLTRNNDELIEFAELLFNKNIKYQLKTTKSIFEIKPSILVYFYLKALYNPVYYSEQLFGLLGSEPFTFEPEDYKYLLVQNRLNHKNFIENIRLNIDYEWKNKIKVINFIETYDKLKTVQYNDNLKNLIVAVCNETGILEYYINTDRNKIDNILSLKRLIDEAVSLKRINKTAGLKEFIEHLDTAFEQNVPITIEKDEHIQNAVQLLTLHGSKGRQFDYVFMPNLVASKWENKRNPNDTVLPLSDSDDLVDDDASERSEQLRLLFVGLTRAKYDLRLSYSMLNNDKLEELTSYLSEIVSDANLCEVENHALSEDGYSLEFAMKLKQETYDYKGVFRQEIEQRAKNIVLSPSTMNSYLNCPREFFYTHVLKIPVYDKNWDNANYGSAVHKTLEYAVLMMKKEMYYPTLEDFIENFLKNINKQEFDTEEIRDKYIQRGKDKLSLYYPHFIQTSFSRLEMVEYAFGSVPVGKYIVTGKIDRIEKNADGTYCLFDYKTGSSKPKSQIADGKEYEKYLNQLRFYKLAYETMNPESKVSIVGLIYPEDFEHNYYTELTQEDNEYIRELIKETYEKIRTLNYEPTENEKNCEYCSYKQLCKLNVL